MRGRSHARGQKHFHQDADPAGRLARTAGSGRSADSCSVCCRWLRRLLIVHKADVAGAEPAERVNVSCRPLTVMGPDLPTAALPAWVVLNPLLRAPSRSIDGFDALPLEFRKVVPHMLNHLGGVRLPIQDLTSYAQRIAGAVGPGRRRQEVRRWQSQEPASLSYDKSQTCSRSVPTMRSPWKLCWTISFHFSSGR